MLKTDLAPSPESSCDVIIIGGGLSGLVSAALLGKSGLSVTVLEMDRQTGGYLAGFTRKNFNFDSSIHWLNQCGPEGYVNRIFQSIRDDYPVCKELDRIRSYRTDSSSYILTKDPDKLKAELLRDFPHESKGIECFFNDAKKIARAFKNHSSNFRSGKMKNPLQRIISLFMNLRFGLTMFRFVIYDGEAGVKKGLGRYFKDRELLQFWSTETDLLSCLVPVAWAYNHDYQCVAQGGSSQIARWLDSVCEESGCRVFTETRVEQILANGKVATTVVARKDGKELLFNPRYIIAAIDVETLYERILPSGLVSSRFLGKLKDADLYSSAVTLSIGLDCPAEALGFDEELITLLDLKYSREELNCGSAEKASLSVFSPSVRDSSMAPEGKGTLVIYAQVGFNQFDTWGTEMDEQGNYIRGEKYKEIKNRYAQTLLERVENQLNIPLKDHIEHLDIATPITYHRYTGNREGVSMGARPGKNNYQAGIAHYQTPLKNVLLGGHWATLGGGIPIAASTGVNTALMILKREKLPAYKKLCRFYDGEGHSV